YIAARPGSLFSSLRAATGLSLARFSLSGGPGGGPGLVGASRAKSRHCRHPRVALSQPSICRRDTSGISGAGGDSWRQRPALAVAPLETLPEAARVLVPQSGP